jgi:hypothetical protein
MAMASIIQPVPLPPPSSDTTTSRVKDTMVGRIENYVLGVIYDLVIFVFVVVFLALVAWCATWYLNGQTKIRAASRQMRNRQQSLIIRQIRLGLQTQNIHVTEETIKRLWDSSPNLFSNEISLFHALTNRSHQEPLPTGLLIASWMYNNYHTTIVPDEMEAATRASLLVNQKEENSGPPVPAKLDRNADLVFAEKFDEGDPFSMQLLRFRCRKSTIARMTPEQRQKVVASLNEATERCPFLLEPVIEQHQEFVKPETTILIQNDHVFYFDETSILKWYASKRYNPTNRTPFTLDELWLLTDSIATTSSFFPV